MPRLSYPELADDEKEDVYNFVDMLESALLATMICCYAQGFATLRYASSEYGYNLNLAEVARIWRNGCIIRSDMLDDIQHAFTEDDSLKNLMIAPYFRDLLKDCQGGWRGINLIAVRHGIPIPAISSALTYYDSYRRKRLPANSGATRLLRILMNASIEMEHSILNGKKTKLERSHLAFRPIFLLYELLLNHNLRLDSKQVKKHLK